MRRLLASMLVLACSAAPAPAAADAPRPDAPRTDGTFFNGRDLTGWSGPAMDYWSVEDGAIVGRSGKPVPRNEFIFSAVEVQDFYLSVDVKLDPNEANAGIQFRSQRLPPNEAIGYQADAGKNVWGRLYHESGRKKLDWRARGEAAVKPGEWNRYEILAVGDRVWTAINGKLAVSVRDPKGERSGLIALQIHSGPPLTARYRINKLVHNPKVELAGLTEPQLDAELIPPEDEPPAAATKPVATRPVTRPATRTATAAAAATRPAGAGVVVPVPASTRPSAQLPDGVRAEQRFGQTPGDPGLIATGFDGKFQLAIPEVVVFAGQTNMVRAQQSGHLEAYLAVRFADQRPRFRSMAWEGDTVYQQWRDLNFGGWRDQLAWAGATTVIAQFGQTEALDGADKIETFTGHYIKLLDQLSSTTKRVVLVSPMPFEKPADPLLPDHSARNADVRAYAEAVKKLADFRDFLYVDLFTPLAARGPGEPRLTSNGVHLTPEGHRVVARIIAEQLGVPPVADDRLEPVRQAVVEKNRLWFDNWRPMNWAFAYGDRQHVPFGQPAPAASQPALRIELEEFKPLVWKADRKVHELAAVTK